MYSLFAVWGACNHAFHLHCILKWVNSQTPQAHCPMCRREWQFKGWLLSTSLFQVWVAHLLCWNLFLFPQVEFSLAFFTLSNWFNWINQTSVIFQDVKLIKLICYPLQYSFGFFFKKEEMIIFGSQFSTYPGRRKKTPEVTTHSVW